METPYTDIESEIEAALLDADLFLKYNAPDRALKRIETAMETNPRSLLLRERMRELALATNRKEIAARQCLTLAALYIERENLEAAHDRLLEAKQLDPRISITPGLEAIRKARHPSNAEMQSTPVQRSAKPFTTLAGDLAAISIFDTIQILENSKLTGSLNINAESSTGKILFNEGLIVDAECDSVQAEAAFKNILDIQTGIFEFERSVELLPIRITTSSNTKLILDSLREIDEERR